MGSRIQKVKVFDLESTQDLEEYTEIISDPNVIVEANETHMTKGNEKLLVVKYSEAEVTPPEEFKTPLLGI